MCNNTVYSIQMRCTLGSSQLLTIVPWSVMAVQMFLTCVREMKGSKFSFRLLRSPKCWKSFVHSIKRQKSRQVNAFSELISTYLLDWQLNDSFVFGFNTFVEVRSRRWGAEKNQG